jgi:amidase
VWRDFVIARHAEDLRMVFELFTGPRVPSSTRRLRVGLLDHDVEFGMEVHPACRAGVHVAAALLESLGHQVDVEWPRTLEHLWTSIFAAYGVVSDAVRPRTIDWVGERLGRPIMRGEVDDSTIEAAARAAARSKADVDAARAVIDAAVAPIVRWWENYDVLVTPATLQPAWPLGSAPGPQELGPLVAPFSLTGQPALSLPLHRTDDGLPVGVQLVGRPGGDELLLGLAEELQRSFDWTTRRPPLR